MPQRTSLNAFDRGRALAWLADGVGPREVGRRLAVSHSTIIRLQQRVQETGSSEYRPRSGRPRSTSRREDRFILFSALRNRMVTANTLRRELRTATHVNVSVSTIRNRLHDFQMHGRRAAVRVPLTAAHRRARVDWCRQHQRWNLQQWANVLFTDESRFSLQFNDGRRRVWRRQGERFIDGAVREVDRYGGGSVMVWAGFHLHGRTQLHVVEGTLTGQRYVNDIVRPLIQPVLQAIGPRAILQEDNAPAHRAHVVRNFMQAQGINRMDFPARSPDLAPIEHLWDAVGRRVADNHPPPVNVNELVRFLTQEWAAIPQDIHRVLVRSMRQRCIECLAANGGHTRY